jgi:hypothetical protein
MTTVVGIFNYTPNLYFGGSQFEHWPGYRLGLLTGFIRGFELVPNAIVVNALTKVPIFSFQILD